MADNKSVGKYRKTYEGDYSKSYKDFLTWKQESIKRQKAYQIVSKKLDAAPYIRNERAKRVEIARPQVKESDRVFADGSRLHQRKSRPTTAKPTQQPTQRETSSTQTNVASQQQKTTTNQQRRPTTSQQQRSTPPQPRPSQAKSNAPTQKSFNANSINVDYPINEISHQVYENTVTKERINLDVARDLLIRAGFTPKPDTKIGTAFFFFVLANMVMGYLAPIVAFIYGGYKIQQGTTTWVKEIPSSYRYEMPTTTEEKSTNLILGIISIIAGIASAIFHYT